MLQILIKQLPFPHVSFIQQLKSLRERQTFFPREASSHQQHIFQRQRLFFFPDQAEMLFLEIEAGLSRASRRAACLDVAKFLSNYNLHMLQCPMFSYVTLWIFLCGLQKENQELEFLSAWTDAVYLVLYTAVQAQLQGQHHISTREPILEISGKIIFFS